MRELFVKAGQRSGSRLGVTYMQVLRELRPDLHRAIAGSSRDPSTDERRLNVFLLWLTDHWQEPEDINIDIEVSGLVLW